MNRLNLPNYCAVAIAVVFCWLNISIVSAQTATNLDCAWCVDPGEVGWGAVPWASLDPELRRRLQATRDDLDALQARVDAEGTVLDFSDPDACVIDESGSYLLDRSWADGGNMNCFPVVINAPSVFLDLRGFFIVGGEFQGDNPTLIVESGRVTIRNGGVSAPQFGIEGVGSARVRLENISATASSLGDNSYVINSRFFCRDFPALELGSDSVVLNSELLSCDSFNGPPALVADGPSIQVRNNTFEGAIFMHGADFAVIEGNVMMTGGFIGVGGNNIIEQNIIGCSGPITLGIRVEGTENIIDSNIIKPAFTSAVCGTGILFLMDGNFYGDNRVSATTPFNLGGTIQTDWGGNVSF